MVIVIFREVKVVMIEDERWSKGPSTATKVVIIQASATVLNRLHESSDLLKLVAYAQDRWSSLRVAPFKACLHQNNARLSAKA